MTWRSAGLIFEKDAGRQRKIERSGRKEGCRESTRCTSQRRR
jgi:hypothetical protein